MILKKTRTLAEKKNKPLKLLTFGTKFQGLVRQQLVSEPMSLLQGEEIVKYLFKKEFVLKYSIQFNQKRALQNFVVKISNKDVVLRMRLFLLSMFQARATITLIQNATFVLCPFTLEQITIQTTLERILSPLSTQIY